MEAFAGAVAPNEGQREQGHQFGQARGVSEMGLLEVKAPCFEATEQSLHLPAVGVGLNGLILGCAEGCQDQPLVIFKTQRGKMDKATPDRTSPRQPVDLAGFERPQECVNAHQPIPVVGDERVALDALVEGNLLGLQPAEPRLTHEFTVGQEDGDPPHAKDRQKALHQGDALGGVGVAGLVQHRPK